jgi:hypothetical protein
MKRSAYFEERLHGGINCGQPRIDIRAVVGICKASIFCEILKVRAGTCNPSLEKRIIRCVMYTSYNCTCHIRSLGQCLEQVLTEAMRKANHRQSEFDLPH